VQLLMAELINGLALGAYPVLAPAYISEITPVVLRRISTATVNTAYAVGQLIASGVLAGTESQTDKWSYDIPFACQWLFSVFISRNASVLPRKCLVACAKRRPRRSSQGTEEVNSRVGRYCSTDLEYRAHKQVGDRGDQDRNGARLFQGDRSPTTQDHHRNPVHSTSLGQLPDRKLLRVLLRTCRSEPQRHIQFRRRRASSRLRRVNTLMRLDRQLRSSYNLQLWTCPPHFPSIHGRLLGVVS
jgi:hypothetical protein